MVRLRSGWNWQGTRTMSDSRKRFRVVVVDNEALARSELLHLLRRHPEIELAGEAESIGEAETVIHATMPDGLFLDIRLDDGSAFDLLPRIPSEIPIVFVTAYDQFALRAFEVNALDYLLKPVEPNRLADAVRRLKQGASTGSQEVSSNPLSSGDVVYLKMDTGRILLRVDMIVAIEADGDYCTVFLRDGRRLYVRHTIKRWDARLPVDSFLRVHRSSIINLGAVQRVERLPGGGREVHLEKLSQPIPVSRANAASLDASLSRLE